MKLTTALKKLVCIHDIVNNIYLHSEKIFKGTKGEKSWMLYHDTLSLMTSEECKKYMQGRGILDRWILPELGHNDGTPYANHPVRNSPEIMPLDCSLNKDIHKGMRRHFIYINKLDKNDEKISINTQKQGVHAYRQLWDPKHLPEGIPSSAFIIQDINQIINENMMRIVMARGVFIPGLGTRRTQGSWLATIAVKKKNGEELYFSEAVDSCRCCAEQGNLIRNAVSMKK